MSTASLSLKTQAHESSDAHKITSAKALRFKEVTSGKSKSIHCSISSACESQVEKNRAICCLLLMLW